MDNINEINGERKSKKVTVVAIGASAGGIEAVSELLKNLPPFTGMAYFYLQHLDRAYPSNLTEILSRETTMQVLDAQDKMEIRPDSLYVITPNNELSIEDGTIKVTQRSDAPGTNKPIDKFFTSLGEEYQEASIGVVLSGAANDGSIGLKTIKLHGGLTFAQDATAQFESMPKNAISEGAVDLVLSPREIAEELAKIAQQKDAYYKAMELSNDEMGEQNAEEIEDILKLLLKSVGVDFRQYKLNTIKRRIIRRMMIHKLEKLTDYFQYIKQNAKEVNLLYQDLLINVTTFFRDAGMSDYLKNTLFPDLLKLKGRNEPIRIWVPACSTGQEVYSIAILLMEALGTMASATPIAIFATDLSEAAINKARLGIYTEEDVADIAPKRLQAFFTKVDGHYRIVKSIRDVCIFATHNIAKDPPFSRLDIISCCNLLIYLDTNLQKKIFNTFHYSLNNTGYLILGKSETVGSSSYLFNLLDKKLKVYTKKKDAIASAIFEMNYRTPLTEKVTTGGLQRPPEKNREADRNLEELVDDVLLKKYTPAAVVVTSELDIMQFRGSTGLFLEAQPGKASLNLIKMARPGLSFELRNIVYKAKTTGAPAKKEGLEVKHPDKTLWVCIEAIPIKDGMESEFYLILFGEMAAPTNGVDLSSVRDKRVQQLEAELTALREDMRSIIESQEAANEELQSANEEIVSSNEELQSINEELETSKEEIESSNEELITINQELQMRNEQLAEEQEYSQAVFNNLKQSLVILDNNLRVKRANPAFYRTFRLSEFDTVGNVLFEIGNKQWNIPKLKELLENLMPERFQFDAFEVEQDFSIIGHKALLLTGSRIFAKVPNEHLVLLAIEDITEMKRLQKLVEGQS